MPSPSGDVEAGGGSEPGDLLDLLVRGELEVTARLVGASNTTLLARVGLADRSALCVYKPIAGEEPLWDFPDGTLAARECAASLLSAAAGWGVVPPTVLRDGPAGPGSVQLWVGSIDDGGAPVIDAPGAGLVDVVPPQRRPKGWLTVLEGEGRWGDVVLLAHADDATLRRMAAFDVVVNNADRKGGHVIRDVAGRVWGIDHGLTFHAEGKLRTVLWGWAGQRLGEDLRELLTDTQSALAGELLDDLDRLLTDAELDALLARTQRLSERDRLPKPPGSRALPWPPL